MITTYRRFSGVPHEDEGYKRDVADYDVAATGYEVIAGEEGAQEAFKDLLSYQSSPLRLKVCSRE